MPEIANALDQVSDRLEEFLRAATSVADEQLPRISPDELADLLTDVFQAGEWLASHRTVVLGPEAKRYRDNLERLQGVLPLIEVELQLERARLQSERTHLERAAEWVRASKPTS